jgi:hypothetical protein
MEIETGTAFAGGTTVVVLVAIELQPDNQAATAVVTKTARVKKTFRILRPFNGQGVLSGKLARAIKSWRRRAICPAGFCRAFLQGFFAFEAPRGAKNPYLAHSFTALPV